MVFTPLDRAKVTSTTTGTGTLTLGSAVSGYQDFSGVGDQNQTYYTIDNGTEWETGMGTYLNPASSLYMSGNSALTVPGSTAFDFGAGNFTIECWFNPVSTSGVQVMLDAWNNSPTRFLLRINTGILQFYLFPGASQTINYTLPSANQWYHVAAVRNGTTAYLYVDGVSRGTPTTPGANAITSSTANWTISRVSVEPYLGYISNIRIVKGTAVYTSNFTPPTAPLSAISGTVLLTAQSKKIVDNSIYSNQLVKSASITGSVDISNSTPSFSSYPKELRRDVVFDSSNSGSLVNLSAGTKNVFIPQPAVNTQGTTPTADDSSVGTDLVAWNNFQKNLYKSINSGVTFKNNYVNGIVTTYSLLSVGTGYHHGGVITPKGDIHFVPYNAPRGQKVSATTGTVSTYSLVYTTTSAYVGGVLAPNGDIHFVPRSANRGQKINSSGVVSTYSLVYTTTNAYTGGVLAPNGEIHFVPYTAVVGQKIDATGVVSTYSLVYTTSLTSYAGGVLAPNGDIHFVPMNAAVGQKISAAGVVSTYSLVFTRSSAYYGGVVAPNGDIHFVPYYAEVGQKISSSGVVSTYSLVYTTSTAYFGGVLAPNGDIHFIPYSAVKGQKVSVTGVVSTYPLAYTVAVGYGGGVLAPNGDIHFVPISAAVGQKISTNPGIPLKLETCLSPFLNKF